LDRVAKCCSGNTAPTIFIGIYQRGLKRAGSVALYTHVTQYCLQPGFPIIIWQRSIEWVRIIHGLVSSGQHLKISLFHMVYMLILT